MPVQRDACKKPIFDWDAWAIQHLLVPRWDGSQSSWLHCVRVWSAKCPQNGLALFPTTYELVRSIVRVTVAESLAYQYRTDFKRLNVKQRRHVNTTASRQQENAKSKVTLYHVVHLVLARYGFDVVLNKMGTTPQHTEALKVRMQLAFDELHSKAESHCDPSTLRASVVGLTRGLQDFIDRKLYLPWYQVPKSALPGAYPLKLSARGFVVGLPKPQVKLNTKTLLMTGDALLSKWLIKLNAPVYGDRWGALLKFLRAHYKCAGGTLTKKTRAEVAYVIMLTILDAAAPESNIWRIAATHSSRSQKGSRTVVFRDLLDLKLDCPTSDINLRGA